MSARNPRRQPVGDMFPGMPDMLAKKPPKAVDGEHEIRTLDQAITRSLEILDEALAAYPIVGTYWLSSGGNDTAIVGHPLRGPVRRRPAREHRHRHSRDDAVRARRR